jgi:nitrogen regulatory protein PII
MRQLKNEKGVTRVESIACRGVHHLQQVKTRAGKLPEPEFYRLLSVIVNDEQADDIFSFIYHNARIGESGRGMLVQRPLLGATAFSIPADIPDEEY